MNIQASPLSPLQRFLSRFHSSSRPNCSPTFVPSLRNPPSRVWPQDPRGEEIRTAKARRLGISTSPQKLNLVAKLVRSLTISEAQRQLAGCNKKAAPIVRATIDAAVTNARTFGLNEHRLIVSEAFVGKGVYIRKLRPWHGKGRFGIEHKKYAHLTVKVRELDEELWEAKVLPQYIHVRRAPGVREDDRNHFVHTSGRVSWTSDLEESFRKTKQSVFKLRAMLGAETSNTQKQT